VTPLEIEVARCGAASVDLEQASLVPSLYHVPRASSYSQAFPPPVWKCAFYSKSTLEVQRASALAGALLS